MENALKKDNFAYDESFGLLDARKAVVKYTGDEKITPSDIILTSGCSMAIEMCIKALVDVGENILIPRPGWNYT